VQVGKKTKKAETSHQKIAGALKIGRNKSLVCSPAAYTSE
jgi:hypothetical protein